MLKSKRKLLLLVGILLFLLGGFLLVEIKAHRNGYSVRKYNKEQMSQSIFSKNKIEDIKPEYYFTGGKNDTVFIYTIDSTYRLVVWKLNEYNNVDLNNFVAKKSNSEFTTSRPIAFVIDHTVIEVNTNILNPQKNIYFLMDTSSKIDSSVNEGSYQFIAMSFNYLRLLRDSINDITIYALPQQTISCNFMTMKSNSVFYLILLTPFNNEGEMKDNYELLRIINTEQIS